MANVKNAPVGRYFTQHGYSQSYPWIVVGESASGKTLTLARVDTDADPEWKAKMDWHVGGFAGHLANQEDQTWLFKGVCPMRKVSIRQSKKGGWVGNGERFTEAKNGPFYFYDYNF